MPDARRWRWRFELELELLDSLGWRTDLAFGSVFVEDGPAPLAETVWLLHEGACRALENEMPTLVTADDIAPVIARTLARINETIAIRLGQHARTQPTNLDRVDRAGGDRDDRRSPSSARPTSPRSSAQLVGGLLPTSATVT